ncbi:MAG TPA: acyl carrier protein [Thermotogota bacterium]|nr:acyl carrier protein [Thermotogota bacterium]HRW91763.1 acyl carrier protein [Thermotogota bacterium]
MTKNEVFKEIKKIIMEKFNMESEDLKLNTSFVEDIGADSLDLVDLVMALEDEFGVKVDEDDTEFIKTLEDATNYIYEKLGGSAEEEDVTEDLEEENGDELGMGEIENP